VDLWRRCCLTVWTALMARWACCWMVFTPVGGSGLWWLPVGRLEKKIKTRGRLVGLFVSREEEGDGATVWRPKNSKPGLLQLFCFAKWGGAGGNEGRGG
jgi:hypothetical protein